jgi:hypothetical protein
VVVCYSIHVFTLTHNIHPKILLPGVCLPENFAVHQKTKDALLGSENNLRLANNKADDLTVKKLTNLPVHQELNEFMIS